MYKEKYIKYKTKYLELKSQEGGVPTRIINIIPQKPTRGEIEELLHNNKFIDKVVRDSNINFTEADKLYLIEQLNEKKLTRKDALDWIAFLSSIYGESRRGNTQDDVIEWTKIKEETINELTKKGTIDMYTYQSLLLTVNGLYNQTEPQKAKRAEANKAVVKKVAAAAAAEKAAAPAAAAAKKAAANQKPLSVKDAQAAMWNDFWEEQALRNNIYGR